MNESSIKILETLTLNDFNEICRLCPSKTNLTQIYDTNNPELLNMLHFCTQLQFDINDGLPNNICQNCVSKLTDSYKFIQYCKLINEAYRKCLTNPEIKVEIIYIQPSIKQEFEEEEEEDGLQETIEEELIKEEIPELPQTIHQNDPINTLHEFVRLGIENGCNSLIMRYFTEPEGPEKLSMHIFLTKFIKRQTTHNYNAFIQFCKRRMTVELCAAAESATVNIKNPELSAELRYGRITSSKMYSVSCSVNPDEYFIENSIGFYKTNEANRSKTNEILKIEKQLAVKIKTTGLILNKDYPEFVAKLDGLTDEAVIKIKCPKNKKAYLKYIDADKALTPKAKTEMHLCMLLANMKTGYLCIIDPSFAGTNCVIKVDFSERYFMDILSKSQEFWKSYVYPALLKTVVD